MRLEALVGTTGSGPRPERQQERPVAGWLIDVVRRGVCTGLAPIIAGDPNIHLELVSP